MLDAYHPFASSLPEAAAEHFTKAASARIHGSVRLGLDAHLAQGAVVRSINKGVVIANDSMVLENCAILGRPEMPTRIGRKVVFGHRVTLAGATLGDLCEIGNNALIMPGARLGDWCILGEGALIPEGATVPDGSVVVGRPGKIIRSLTERDRAMIVRLRGGDVSLSPPDLQIIESLMPGEPTMGKLYSYRDKSPQVPKSTFLFDSAEITGDVVVGENCIIGAGVKIIGDSHGPVRIGDNVQILENTVLHLLPDNRLILHDDVIIGPGCMIHGCEIGTGSVVEPGAIVCDYSQLGSNTLVKAGAMIKQRSEFPDHAVLDGFPARPVDTLAAPLSLPGWALRQDDLHSLAPALVG